MNCYDYLFKVSIIGDSGVGKSSLLVKYTDDVFNQQFNSTIGVDFRSKIFKYGDKNIKLQIWDTTGQERFRPIVSNFYAECNGIIIVYDVSNRTSFNNVISWLRDIEYNKPPFIPVILVGNKIDINIEDRKISYKEGLEFAIKHKINFIETSAKDNINVEDVFLKIAKEMKLNYINNDGLNVLQKHKNEKSQYKKGGNINKDKNRCCGDSFCSFL